MSLRKVAILKVATFIIQKLPLVRQGVQQSFSDESVKNNLKTTITNQILWDLEEICETNHLFMARIK